MGEQSRRFTDREVALVLKKATELDDTDAEAHGGMSLQELTSIGGEVGISSVAIERAVASLARGARPTPSLAGAPRVRKAVHAVRGELDQEGIARLVRLVDERADGAGSVSEALGSIRWTGADRFKSTRVSITPRGGETAIEVVEKAEPRMRRILHLLPAAWAAVLAGPLLGAAQLSPPGTIALAGLSIVAGAGVGRVAWNVLSAMSDRRVRKLAERLADEAKAILDEADVIADE